MSSGGVSSAAGFVLACFCCNSGSQLEIITTAVSSAAVLQTGANPPKAGVVIIRFSTDYGILENNCQSVWQCFFLQENNTLLCLFTV